VHFIRTALDRAHLPDTRIMSYAAKFASHYYGPFRDAADCAPRTGDRRGYQMDPANGAEALEEIAADIEQGADQIIVKPALAYLDVVSAAARRFDTPLAAYNVSGEFAMLQNAVDTGLAAPGIVAESLTAIKRAGARRIISYFTPSLLRNHTGGQDVALF
jgi:porphobilinogen synthase